VGKDIHFRRTKQKNHQAAKTVTVKIFNHVLLCVGRLVGMRAGGEGLDIAQ
jgi:hypothetical protein